MLTLTQAQVDAVDYLTPEEKQELDQHLIALADRIPACDYRTAPDWFHEGQRRLWESTALDTVASAGSQGGKTASEAPWLLREIQRCAPLIRRHNGGKFLYAGPTLTLMSAQAIPQFKELFEEQEQLGTLVLSPKPKFTFSKAGLLKIFGFCDVGPVTVHFAYTNDSSNLESMTAFAGVWDEAGQKENRLSSYGAFNRRLKLARTATFDDVLEYAPDWWVQTYYADEGGAATFGRRLWGTTPYEWNWFKNEVYDRAEKKQDGFTLVNWPSWNNPRVSEAECEKEKTLIPLWQWLMMYLGLYTKPAGVIYDTFDCELDTCDDFPVPTDWPIYPGVDFGSVNLGGVLVTFKPTQPEVLYVIHCYHAGRQRTYKDHIDGICGGYTVRVGCGGNKHGEDDSREAFRSKGLPLDEPPVNEVKVGIACVYEQVKPHRLMFFRSAAAAVIVDMQNYSRKLGPDGEPTEEIDEKSKWHLMDALRYIISKLRPNRKKRQWNFS